MKQEDLKRYQDMDVMREHVRSMMTDEQRQAETIQISNEPLTIEDYQALVGMLNEENERLREALYQLAACVDLRYPPKIFRYAGCVCCGAEAKKVSQIVHNQDCAWKAAKRLLGEAS